MAFCIGVGSLSVMQGVFGNSSSSVTHNSLLKSNMRFLPNVDFGKCKVLNVEFETC